MASRLVLLCIVLVLAVAGSACNGGGSSLDVPATAVPNTAAATTTLTMVATTTEPQVQTATVLVIPAAFTPSSGEVQYENNGSDLHVIGGSLTFFAPLSFAAPLVNLESLTIIAHDDTPGANVCVMLVWSSPLERSLGVAAQVCTGDGPLLPQVRTVTDLDIRQVDTASQAAFLLVTFSGPGPSLAGVQVTYSY